MKQTNRRRGPAPGARKEPVALKNAIAAWGDELPDWIEVLAQECDRPGSSMAAVGDAIGYAGSVLSQVFNRKYPGDMARVALAVHGAFMGITVTCPILGDIPVNECISHQRAPMVTSNRQRIALWQNCNGAGLVPLCPNSKRSEGSDNVE